MLALADTEVGCCGRAVLVHNDAVARLVRISQDERVAGGQNWPGALAGLGVVAAGGDPFVDPWRFAEVVVADDVNVAGMRHRFRTCGLGVPVIGTRASTTTTLPRPMSSSSRVGSGSQRPCWPCPAAASQARRTGCRRSAWSFTTRSGSTPPWSGWRDLPLASDRTTHLALQASQDRLPAQAIRGVIASEFGPEIEPGLFMLRPYAPDKIPLVFVHGLAATPVAFLQAINEFQNDPGLSTRYQFWVFIYPTGRPIVESALRLREELGRAQATYGADPAFHQMVIVGHSMGGILAHMVVSDSGRQVWDSALSVPPEALRASPATAPRSTSSCSSTRCRTCAGHFHRHPPSGKPAREQHGRSLFGGLVRPFAKQTAHHDELRALNGPAVIRDENFQGRTINAIGNLRVDSPLLQAIGLLPVAPGVPYHTIAFRFAGHAPGDLVVPLWSPAGRGCVGGHLLRLSRLGAGPGRTGEMRRILLEYLTGP